jgi:hypothetical protein
MTKVRLLTALSLGTMLFASCEKQAEETPSPKAATQSVTASATLAGDWQLVSYKGIVPAANPENSRVTNVFAMLKACKKDDKLHFTAEGELTVLPGATQCDNESEAAAKPGTWALSSDEKTLTLTLDQSNTMTLDKVNTYEITSITANKLTMRTVAAANAPYTELEYKR